VKGGVVKLTEVVVMHLELLTPMRHNYQLTTIIPQVGADTGELAQSRAEVTSLKCQLAAKDTLVEELRVKTAVFEREIAALNEEMNVCNDENAKLKPENEIRRQKGVKAEPMEVVRLLVEGPAALHALDLPCLRDGVVAKRERCRSCTRRSGVTTSLRY
jgi:septal ring factor EnvC (AmiA/AmiB activator)